MRLAHLFVEVVEVTVAVFHSPRMLPVCNFYDINLKHMLNGLETAGIPATSGIEGWSRGDSAVREFRFHSYPTESYKTEINQADRPFSRHHNNNSDCDGMGGVSYKLRYPSLSTGDRDASYSVIFHQLRSNHADFLLGYSPWMSEGLHS